MNKAELERLKNRIDTILNNVLVDMKPGWDDSIEGFNKAWDITRDIFKEEIGRVAVPTVKMKYWWSEDKKWFCILSDDGNNQTTISLTAEEASLLSMNAEPPIEAISSAEMRAERLMRDAR